MLLLLLLVYGGTWVRGGHAVADALHLEVLWRVSISASVLAVREAAGEGEERAELGSQGGGGGSSGGFLGGGGGFVGAGEVEVGANGCDKESDGD